VIGAGIVGLAVARALVEPDPSRVVTVVDKETSAGAHQSGHNSGVLHSGLYYRPGSHKARLCGAGRIEIEEYCRDRGIAYEQCGKVVVATSPDEIPGLMTLRERGLANGLVVTLLDRRGLAAHEPHADGVMALFVPATGVVDFGLVTRHLADELVERGVGLRLGCEVTSIDERAESVVVNTTDGEIAADRLINCGGLHADSIATMSGARATVRIMPFRGEYSCLVPERSFLVRHLIYPVPDPRFPFLGAHFTRGIDDVVHAGPNAVLALAREGYSWRDLSSRHLRSLAGDKATWRLAARYWRTGLGEVVRSLVRASTVRSLQRLVPDVRADDLVPDGSGVRAQAVNDDGTLADDFVLERTARCVHVLNAPSPAATSSLAIGRWIAAASDDGST
jgi:L-2-hydroxyglutarate oxidase